MLLHQTNSAEKQNQCRLTGLKQPPKGRGVSVDSKLDTHKNGADKLWWVKRSNFQQLQTEMLFELQCWHVSGPIKRMYLCWARPMKQGSEGCLPGDMDAQNPRKRWENSCSGVLQGLLVQSVDQQEFRTWSTALSSGYFLNYMLLHIKPWGPTTGRGLFPRMAGQCLFAVIICPNKMEEGHIWAAHCCPSQQQICPFPHSNCKVPSWHLPLPFLPCLSGSCIVPTGPTPAVFNDQNIKTVLTSVPASQGFFFQTVY